MGATQTAYFVSRQGASSPIEIKRRKGSRHLRISIGMENQIVASAPWRCSLREVTAFVEKHRDWIEAQLKKVPARQALSEWFETSPWLSGSGDRFTVSLQKTDATRSNYRFDQGGSEIILQLPAELDLEVALVKLVRRFAQDALHCRVAYHAKRLDLKYSRVSVRDQTGRWGSCSSSGVISLNWRLVLLEPDLQDYIILHELAHLTEMNHSKRFWALLDGYHPMRKADEARLDGLTSEIMRVGRL